MIHLWHRARRVDPIGIGKGPVASVVERQNGPKVFNTDLGATYRLEYQAHCLVWGKNSDVLVLHRFLAASPLSNHLLTKIDKLWQNLPH